MGIRKKLEEVKRWIAEGGRVIDQKVEERMSRTHLLAGSASNMLECAYAISGIYSARGYSTQRFSFREDDVVGRLVQIRAPVEGWKQRLAKTLAGQQLAVNVRLFPKGDDLEVSIDCGKWVDKAMSGVLAWSVFTPLIVFPVVGLWRQRQLIECVERETLEWLSARHRMGCIDV